MTARTSPETRAAITTSTPLGCSNLTSWAISVTQPLLDRGAACQHGADEPLGHVHVVRDRRPDGTELDGRPLATQQPHRPWLTSTSSASRRPMPPWRTSTEPAVAWPMPPRVTETPAGVDAVGTALDDREVLARTGSASVALAGAGVAAVVDEASAVASLAAGVVRLRRGLAAAGVSSPDAAISADAGCLGLGVGHGIVAGRRVGHRHPPALSGGPGSCRAYRRCVRGGHARRPGDDRLSCA